MLALKNKERNGMNVLKEKLRTKRKIYGFKKAVKREKPYQDRWRRLLSVYLTCQYVVDVV